MIHLPFLRRRSGWLGGVCAGVSDFTSIPVLWLRLAFGFALFCFLLPTALLYLLLFILMKPKHNETWLSLDRFARRSMKDVTPSERDAADLAKGEDYARLSQRLAALEAQASSEDTALRQRFRDAGLI